MATSRSGLYFQPYVDPVPGFRVSIALDYASVIEAPFDRRDYLLDAELARLDAGVSRDLGRATFLLAGASLLGSYDGFLDGLVDDYHRILGVKFLERRERPRNEFRYQVPLPSGILLTRKHSTLGLGDIRLGLGRRHRVGLQSVASLTLPTTTGPAGYGRGTVSIGLIESLRHTLAPRLTYEGSLGLGFTPEHGDLETVQRDAFLSFSSGLRARLFGRQSLYGNVFYHTPYYHGTAVRSLDRSEVSLDFGWIGGTHRGAEWRLGLTEDLKVSGPAVDLILRLGVCF